ncbi:sodium:solute symporter family protein [Methanospirillum hungatei]|jgi:SSS family solute:Na+ symporter|uniref:sodium:solute symporter family protein n=1 Tax=Methanospirillum hungatei TaxID=2203 RepID=UPI0009CE7027|nr:sodium:solute symporter family protein [Methanospirillum hungatei]MBP7034320.1 sodium:solute symporter family protein [Methanospirillum sp.]MBP9008546.1 sodium:solute symporter family protein [Methanospirillum sp.]OQA54653.1 MAG: sodium/panthothenate symporter [Euryarchaeota archaeon ADurb.Bin294]HOW04437.1 sodium:solute symporter family protein [Methanospirillum hungatei]
MAVDPAVTIILVLVYVVITLVLGYLGYKKTIHAEDYLLAGRDSHPVIIALSYGATFISTSAIVGFGGVAANLGMGLIWLTVFNIGVGILLAFVLFGKKTREKGAETGAITFPDLMGKIFNTPKLQFISGIIILLGMPLYTAAVLIGGARFLETTLSISYTTALIGFAVIVALYVIYGGLIAVMYTDAFQGAIMLIGMTILLVLTYIYVGGVTAGNTALAAMSDLVPETLASQGMTGWASMPELGSPIWFTLITTLVLGVGIGVLAQPQLVVRFMTARENRALNRAVLVGGPFILMMTGVAFTVGALTNVYFYQHMGKIAVDAAGGNVDSVIPLYINTAMPDLFVIIFMLTLLSAAMSTLSSLYHTMGTALVCDLWGRGQTCAMSLRANQIGCIVMMVLSVVLALAMPASIIARATAMFMGLCASAFLPAFAVGVYSKRPSRAGAMASMLTGAFIWFFYTVFIHTAEAKALGISQFLTGSVTILGAPWTVIDPLVIALPISLIVMIVFQLRERSMEGKSRA